MDCSRANFTFTFLCMNDIVRLILKHKQMHLICIPVNRKMRVKCASKYNLVKYFPSIEFCNPDLWYQFRNRFTRLLCKVSIKRNVKITTKHTLYSLRTKTRFYDQAPENEEWSFQNFGISVNRFLYPLDGRLFGSHIRSECALNIQPFQESIHGNPIHSQSRY